MNFFYCDENLTKRWGSLGKKPALRWMRRKTSFGSSSWVDGPPWINRIMHDNDINLINNMIMISHCQSIKRVKLGKLSALD